MKDISKIKALLGIIIIASILLSSCSNDDSDKGDYSTVSNMISDRNKARYKAAQQHNSSQKSTSFKDDSVQEEAPPAQESEEKKSVGMTFDEEIRIISESTGKTLATGTASLDKSGKIVNIRIRK